ncbi:MAG: dTDP-4-amino-4,6-dideoxygalactose transaminase [Deltaproteobacteria bacterium]|nr:dTDP-4-amino-4,6-dideoxygalactose transaminase [Deltaproteobacteria bacterium]
MTAAPTTPVPFNRPFLTGRETAYLQEALQSRSLAGDGPFTRRCHAWLEGYLGARKALLTHSCTAALEMAALLCDLEPGDEVILPSFTFVSTANAIVLRRAVPVFVDIRPDTLNLDENRVEEALTPRTRAVFVVHYAGIAAEMDAFLALGKRHGLRIVEDAAQGVMARYKGKPLGTLGDLGCLSFHETKNLVSGEGGALLVNDDALAQRAEIIREKGTNRAQFFRGQVDKYTWVDIGSSFLPSELVAAMLLAQLEEGAEINASRARAWIAYHTGLADLEASGRLRRPIVPAHVEHNSHLYYVLTASLDERTRLIAHLKARSIQSVFHYVPLHSAPAGRKHGRAVGDLAVTQDTSDRLLRLPMYAGLDDVERVVDAVHAFYA